MNLRQVKNVIFQTECENVVCEGLCCSEPIMTRDRNGIIDNYFIYGCNEEQEIYTRPVKYFGIYSDEKKTAYIRECETSKTDIIKAVKFDFYDSKAYGQYITAYPKVRALLFKKHCNEEEKKVLQSYWEAFQVIIDQALIPVYQEAFPDFFSWLKEEL